MKFFIYSILFFGASAFSNTFEVSEVLTPNIEEFTLTLTAVRIDHYTDDNSDFYVIYSPRVEKRTKQNDVLVKTYPISSRSDLSRLCEAFSFKKNIGDYRIEGTNEQTFRLSQTGQFTFSDSNNSVYWLQCSNEQ